MYLFRGELRCGWICSRRTWLLLAPPSTFLQGNQRSLFVCAATFNYTSQLLLFPLILCVSVQVWTEGNRLEHGWGCSGGRRHLHRREIQRHLCARVTKGLIRVVFSDQTDVWFDDICGFLPPTVGSKGSRRTSRTLTSTITPSLGRETSTGASSSRSTTSWPRRRLSSRKKSPCLPGMRLSTRSLLVLICKCGMLTISPQMTS